MSDAKGDGAGTNDGGLSEIYGNICPGYPVYPAVATVDKKSGEAAILHLAERLEVPLMIISRKMIGNLDFQTVPGGPLEFSAFVEKTLGVGSVAEASAYLAARSMAGGAYETGRCVAEKRRPA
ncbi:MAG: cobalamin biosynthesis protein [Frisingicoccus sp.]